MSIEKVISKFPKHREPLGKKYEKIFENEYKLNREGKLGLISKWASRLEEWMHKKVAQNDEICDLLEVGAGTLNHLKFEYNYTSYDIVEPFTNLYVNNEDKRLLRNIYASLKQVPIKSKYKRIISIATFEHMDNLPYELELIEQLLDKNGQLQVGIPTEGSFLWGLSWRCSTGLSFRVRTGLSYANVMKHEHINNEHEILSLMKHYFDVVKIERFPLPFKHCSFYTYIHARKKL